MKIEVRFRRLEPSDALRDHAVRRVHFHLSRFGHEISAVRLRISDVNGPKGGLDKQCQVTVQGRRISSVLHADLSGDAYSAVDMAVEKTGRAVRRALEKVRVTRTFFPIPRTAS